MKQNITLCKFCHSVYPITNLNENCFICNGTFTESFFEEITDKCRECIKDYEINTFSIGCRLPTSIISQEKIVRKTFNISSKDCIVSKLKTTFAEKISNKLQKRYVQKDGDVVFIIDVTTRSVDCNIKPIYIFGHYLKLKRGFPQTNSPCPFCNGIGCDLCEYSGKKFNTSVEDEIQKIFLPAFNAKKVILHACGREDNDVRALCAGRPFVVEVQLPKIRNVNLEALNGISTGLVSVKDLRYTSKSTIKYLKSKNFRKKYRAIVETDHKFTSSDVTKIENFPEVIHQRTPLRVLTSRKDKVRVKRVYSISAKLLNKKQMEVLLITDGGLYIKELINGDSGRTRPSFSEVLKKNCRCVELDFLGVVKNGKEV